MARLITPLTDSFIKRLKFDKEKSNKHYDGDGLILEVRPTGAKKWRLDFYKPDGKRSMMTLGDYPQLTLAQARAKREEIKQQLVEGLNPVVERQIQLDKLKMSSGNTFQSITDEFLEFKRGSWSHAHYQRMRNALKNNAYQYIGGMSIARVTGKLVLDIVRQVEARGAIEMASRVFDAISMVMRYASATGRVEQDVTYGLEQFLAERPPVKHFPHVDEDSLPALLHAVKNYDGRRETVEALYLMMRTFPRTKELVYAKWEEFDLDEAVWRIPSMRMKGKIMVKLHGSDHLIPLSVQVVARLRRLKEVNGRFQYLFPGVRNPATRPISLETMNKALRILGFKGQQTGHGFRGLFSTIANESGLFRKEVIKTQLSHKTQDKVSAAYNHAQYWDERCEMMQWWSDYLDGKYGEFKD